MIAGLLFSVLWRISGIVLLPVLFCYKRTRRHIFQVPAPIPGRTWIHGASIGEHRITQTILPYIGPAWCTHSSWRSHPTGTFPAPLDLPGVIGPWLDRARPGRLILIEGELWPGWLIECRKRNIPVAVLAARKGPGWKRWQRIRSVFLWLTRDVVWMYTDDIGDLKQVLSIPDVDFDVPANAIVGASTREGDERVLISAWESLPQPRPKLILAPRHLHRVDTIVEMASKYSVAQRSTGLDEKSDIWVIDTHGELAAVVARAHIAFIGGTLDPTIGGHSPSEAARGGTHIVHGPYTHANDSIWNDLPTTIARNSEELTSQFRRLLLTKPPPPSEVRIDIAKIVSKLPTPTLGYERPILPWLWPLVFPWNLLSRLVRRLEGYSSETSFVVVGGLANGGAGRTPVAAWLAKNIDNSLVLSAGYKRSEAGTDVRVGRPSDASSTRLGDELEMIRRRGHTVISAPNRTEGLAQCLANTTPIIDGGLGDTRLQRGFRIACIDGVSPRGGGPFPVGRLRLPWTILNQVDAIWVCNAPDDQKLSDLPAHIPVVHSQMRPTGWIHKGKIHPLNSVKGQIDVVVGIANPERFICTLLDLDLTIRSIRIVGDHSPLGALPPAAVITEKDAARIPEDSDTWALKMDLSVSGADVVLTHIREHCG